MRLFTMLACIILGVTLSVGTYAADDFGARFSEEAPTALADPEEALAEIMPAAGVEELAEQPLDIEVENTQENAVEEPVPVIDLQE